MKKAPPSQSQPALASDSHIPSLQPPIDPEDPPFVRRAKELIYHWVQEEWAAIQSIKESIALAPAGRKKASVAMLTAAITDAKLNTVNLTRRLDNMSSSALYKELTAYGAQPPGRLIRQARIDYAKHLLEHSRLTVAEIIERAGFRDYDNFSDNFKTSTGMTPSQYRDTTRQQLASTFRRNRKP